MIYALNRSRDLNKPKITQCSVSEMILDEHERNMVKSAIQTQIIEFLEGFGFSRQQIDGMKILDSARFLSFSTFVIIILGVW